MNASSRLIALTAASAVVGLQAHAATLLPIHISNPSAGLNDTAATAQVLNAPGAFTAGFDPEIPGSDHPFATHVTLLGESNGSFQWFAFNHPGGDIYIDVDDPDTGLPPFMQIGFYDRDPSTGLVNLVTAVTDGALSDADAGSTNDDPFIFAPGRPAGLYYFGIASETATFDSGSLGVSGAPLASGSSYDVHVVVPEPSIAILGGLGLLGILRRRRG
jgi:hypothetical protein